MKLVVDANILVGECLRARGRQLLQSSQLELYIAVKMFEETCYEINRRTRILRQQGKLTESTEQELIFLIQNLFSNSLNLKDFSFYSHLETEAKKRIPRDPNDWQTVALALALEVAIWTQDYGFLGCGCATWTTETILQQLNG